MWWGWCLSKYTTPLFIPYSFSWPCDCLVPHGLWLLTEHHIAVSCHLLSYHTVYCTPSHWPTWFSVSGTSNLYNVIDLMLKVTGVTPHHLTCSKFAAVQGDCPHVGGPQHVYGAEIVDCGSLYMSICKWMYRGSLSIWDFHILGCKVRFVKTSLNQTKWVGLEAVRHVYNTPWSTKVWVYRESCYLQFLDVELQGKVHQNLVKLRIEQSGWNQKQIGIYILPLEGRKHVRTGSHIVYDFWTLGCKERFIKTSLNWTKLVTLEVSVHTYNTPQSMKAWAYVGLRYMQFLHTRLWDEVRQSLIKLNKVGGIRSKYTYLYYSLDD